MALLSEITSGDDRMDYAMERPYKLREGTNAYIRQPHQMSTPVEESLHRGILITALSALVTTTTSHSLTHTV